MDIKKITEFRKFHGVSDFVQNMSAEQYKDALKKDAVIHIDPHGYIVESFSGMSLAADDEQLNLLIAHLEEMRVDVGRKSNSR
ncbi:hypothetical protein [Citrobacter braakii]|uniref:hypothetical protein n=1 Tax=Citrobacter braakii TaxID=57706 RepID=UPI004039A417